MSDIELRDIVVTLGALTALEIDTFETILLNEIEALRLRGVSEEAIFQVLLNDAQTGGRVFGALAAGIKSQMYTTISDAARAGSKQYYEEQGISTDLLKWRVVSKKPCDDCLGREGRVETSDYWDVIGRPGTGITVCKGNCQCDLDPVELASPDRVILK